MHVMLTVLVLALCWGLRRSVVSTGWVRRWPIALLLFLWPPCLLLTTALSTLWMCPDHFTLVHWDDGAMHLLSLLFLGSLTMVCLRLAAEGYAFIRQIARYPLIDVAGRSVRVIDTPEPFVAQVGFWRPQLVVSSGLMVTLPQDHLKAVLCHEEAHYYYRDTFWFFWLGCLRRATDWLPNTKLLWEELLALRELRADQWTAQRVDPLLLAESLVLVVQPNAVNLGVCSASIADGPHRLTERIDALLRPTQPLVPLAVWFWLGLLLGMFPLLAVPLHLGCLD
ncbi:M56 family metallopeptidase [Anthocerotibacter panamensis]|uniref:M56 family metallopeptidase n=1 Tax=Anthocerotibacter panamensis TaxID=2857077 RepID=UPI001C40595E|nr:M56 family metallopeptidase [Anthocerotibacter panamensis]